MFQNDTIQLQNIPQYQQVETQSLHPNYKKIILFNAFCKTIIALGVCCAIFLIFSEVEKWYFMALFLLISIFIIVYPILSFNKKKYAFRAHDVIFKKGLIFKATHISPYIRLQHVVIKQGWYEKKLGLATLVLYTAAGNFSDIAIPGLSLEDAERWKNFLMNRMEDLNNESENEL